jgi:hypothetical protein
MFGRPSQHSSDCDPDRKFGSRSALRARQPRRALVVAAVVAGRADVQIGWQEIMRTSEPTSMCLSGHGPFSRIGSGAALWR